MIERKGIKNKCVSLFENECDLMGGEKKEGERKSVCERERDRELKSACVCERERKCV